MPKIISTTIEVPLSFCGIKSVSNYLSNKTGTKSGSQKWLPLCLVYAPCVYLIVNILHFSAIRIGIVITIKRIQHGIINYQKKVSSNPILQQIIKVLDDLR